MKNFCSHDCCGRSVNIFNNKCVQGSSHSVLTDSVEGHQIYQFLLLKTIHVKKCVKVSLCDSFSALKLESDSSLDEGTQKQIMVFNKIILKTPHTETGCRY